MLLNCFDVVNSSHALVVGVNLVGQENNANSLANYWLAMRFVRLVEVWTRHCPEHPPDFTILHTFSHLHVP